MVSLGESGKVVLIKAFQDKADRDHEVQCYRRLRSLQGVFVPHLLKERCRPPSLHDERQHALILSWIGPLWGLPNPEFSVDELLGVRAGLSHMHALGVVHQDLWPRNLVRDGSGRVFLVDFGMAMLRSSASPPGASGLFEEECARETELLGEHVRRAKARQILAGSEGGAAAPVQAVRTGLEPGRRAAIAWQR